MFPAVLLIAILFACVARANDTGLIRVGEVWRYTPATNEPAADWRARDYNDSTWPFAPAGFSTDGYFPERTLLNGYGNPWRTVLFRKTFSQPNLANIARLIFRVDYDDGFVAWLNGVEIARRGISGNAGEPVPADAFAIPHTRGLTEEIDVSRAIGALNSGTNVLAVQLLGSATNDFTACFVSELLANMTRGPFLQSTTSNSVQVVWKTPSPASAFLEFGSDRTNATRIELAITDTNHVVLLTNLQADAFYEYRVGIHYPEQDVVTDWSSFRTLKISGSVVFDAIGDTGWASDGQFQIARGMRDSHPDLIMHLGDSIYYGFNQYMADLRLFSIYEEQLRNTPMFLVLGNHEMYLDRTAVFDCFHLPTNSVTGTEHFYSFDHGDVHFAIVWSDLFVGADFRPGSAQYNWLSNDLATTTKPWKFMFFHHVWRSSSVHEADDYDYNKVPDIEQIEDGPLRLARQFGVQIVFNGHDHGYQRLMPGDGPMSFVSGGGGAMLYPFARLHPEMAQFYSRYNFLRVSVNGAEATVDAIGADEAVLDTVTIRRTAPERKIYRAAWHTPPMTAGPANDLDGNIQGQTFGFSGAPITGQLGRFTSTGRLHINNDDQKLYLGFDQVMLRAGEELFVFLESPHINGVTSMETVGNGVVDPEGEGADGLDFLSNLSFTNFTPSVGLILGDEFGDVPAPSFWRAGQTNNTGQGAFYLNQTNTDGMPAIMRVPGQKIAQFNHAPQDAPAPYEQNADFIVVSLPLANLQLVPGDHIRIGAVAGRAAIDAQPVAQTRVLDSGGLGFFMADTNRTWMEGVEIELASGPPLISDLQLGLDEQNGVMTFFWDAVPGEIYQLEYSEHPAGPYHQVTHPSVPKRAQAVKESIRLNFSPDLPPRSRYYRLQHLAE